MKRQIALLAFLGLCGATAHAYDMTCKFRPAVKPGKMCKPEWKRLLANTSLSQVAAAEARILVGSIPVVVPTYENSSMRFAYVANIKQELSKTLGASELVLRLGDKKLKGYDILVLDVKDAQSLVVCRKNVSKRLYQEGLLNWEYKEADANKMSKPAWKAFLKDLALQTVKVSSSPIVVTTKTGELSINVRTFENDIFHFAYVADIKTAIRAATGVTNPTTDLKLRLGGKKLKDYDIVVFAIKDADAIRACTTNVMRRLMQ